MDGTGRDGGRGQGTKTNQHLKKPTPKPKENQQLLPAPPPLIAPLLPPGAGGGAVRGRVCPGGLRRGLGVCGGETHPLRV